MKLKKLFLASAISLLFSSCASNNVALIPGASKSIENKILTEYANIADVYYSLEKYEKAIEYYKLALDSKENYWTIYYKLAKTYAIQSKWDDALPMYQTILQRDPGNCSLKASVAYIHAKKGNVQEAIKEYDELMKLDSENTDYIQNKISLLLIEKDLENASLLIEDFSKNYPENENISKFQGELNKIKKELEESKENDSSNSYDVKN